jgi:carboxylesterase type B
MFIPLSLLLLSSLLASATPTPRQVISRNETTSAPIVHLDYITLRGAFSPVYNLTHFRRIPFGASTAPPNRFLRPQPPPVFPNGTDYVYETDAPFDMCPQRTVNGSEDCLYLGIYSRPWTASAADIPPRGNNEKSNKEAKLRPVLLTFYGGGFMRGAASFDIPPSGFPVLNASQLNDYVVVYSNYRTNVFGFLPGGKIGRAAAREKGVVDLNPGLLDQRAALQWIQKYIHHFGGDKTNVTIWGQSAGGGSVIAQTISSASSREEPLFSKAMATSPFWPKTYRYDAPESEAIYDAVVRGVGCNDARDPVQCLKEVDVQKLRDVALRINDAHTYTTSSLTWAPVVGGDAEFLAEPLSEVVKKGKLNARTVMASYNLHEGESFVPPGFLLNGTAVGSSSDGFNSSKESFDVWLKGFLPGFGRGELEGVKELYPAAGVAEEMRWNASQTFERAGMVYRDLVLACPALWLAGKAEESEGGKGWLMEYTVAPAKHASDTVYVSFTHLS